jgi:hypothetical protein
MILLILVAIHAKFVVDASPYPIKLNYHKKNCISENSVIILKLPFKLAKTLHDEIEQQRAEAMELFSEKDFDNLVSYFTPDATLMFPGKDNIQGKDGSYQFSCDYYT